MRDGGGREEEHVGRRGGRGEERSRREGEDGGERKEVGERERMEGRGKK